MQFIHKRKIEKNGTFDGIMIQKKKKKKLKKIKINNLKIF